MCSTCGRSFAESVAIPLVAKEMIRDMLIPEEDGRVTPPMERQKRSNLPDLEVARQYDQERTFGKRSTTGRCLI